MKTRTTIALTALLSLSLCGGGLALARNSALAAAATAEPELFLPSSYEQYLDLENPTDVALNENYIAVADGSKLFLYDRAASSYSFVEHQAENGVLSDISKLQFSSDGCLYYSDRDSHLYRYDFDAREETIQQNIPCATFVLDGTTLYTASVTGTITTFHAISREEGSRDFTFKNAKPIKSIEDTKTPCMFVKNGWLYCAINSNFDSFNLRDGEYTYSGGRLAGENVLVQGLSSVAVLGEEVYFSMNNRLDETSEQNGLYRGKLNDSAEQLLSTGGIKALTAYDGKLYCVKGSSVTELAPTEEGLVYTGYEIAADSNSPNRLSDAGDTVRAKTLIVTADRGNNRTTVYDASDGSYAVLKSGAPDFVATDGETVAVAAGKDVKVFRKGETEPSYLHSTENPVVGLAVVYGRTYYVTSHHFGVAEENATEIARTDFSPAALACDVFGDLYVVEASRKVARFSEKEFLDRDAKGEEVTVGEAPLVLPEGFSSLRCDFEGNLYYLLGESVFRNGEEIVSLAAEDAVYHGTAEGKKPVSFALGYEDDDVYAQYGNYACRYRDLGFPTLSSISAEGVYDDAFAAPETREPAFLDVRAGATGIRTDLGALTAFSETFAYESYARTEEGGRAVLIAARGDYRLAALYENHAYTLALFRASDCKEAAVSKAELSPAPRYLSSEVAFSYFPCLAPALSRSRLPRATEVALLAVYSPDGGFDFAYVRHGNEFGYLPLAYLTECDPASPPAETYFIGYLKGNADGVTFHSESGDLLVTESVRLRVYDLNNGLYRAEFEKEGVLYYAQITQTMLRTGNANVIRTALIVILCVVAVGIVTAYVLLIPRRKK